MPPLNVPERYRPGLSAFLALNEKAVDTVVSALAGRTTSASSSSLAVAITPSLGSGQARAARDVATAILSLYSLRANREQTAEELARDLTDAIAENSYPGLSITQEDREQVLRKLTKVLGVDSLLIRRKIRDVLGDKERRYCTAKILSDIRPIFGIHPSDDIIDARVTHTLKISYHSGDNPTPEDIFISMSEQDLKGLRSLLDREEMKSKKLRQAIERMGIRHD